ncbi:MAG: DsbA family protein [Kangiellaceae bacterium]
MDRLNELNIEMKDIRLIYVHDPMCSWCWGFEPVRTRLFNALPKNLKIEYLLGGLAPDSDQPMTKEMQSMLQSTWLKIQKTIPGTQFNFDFWTKCLPRRSTYPSNRAVIAARMQGEKFAQFMTLRIQEAYYLEAKNPSDNNTLVALSNDLGLDSVKFEKDLVSKEVDIKLKQEISFCREMKMNSFPSLAIQSENKLVPIKLDYLNENSMLREIHEISR